MKLSCMLLLTLMVTLVLVVAQSHVTFQDANATRLRVDTGTYGPSVEEVHYYYDQWPIGLAVSLKGRIFVCYTRGNYVSGKHGLLTFYDLMRGRHILWAKCRT